MRLERIVVGVDGSPNSLVAVEWAAGMASLVAAEVVAVHAMGLLEQMGSGDPAPSFPHRAEIQQAFEATWCHPLQAAGVRYRCLLRDGSAVPVLLAVSDEVGADLVVVGSRGLGGYPGAPARQYQHAGGPERARAGHRRARQRPRAPMTPDRDRRAVCCWIPCVVTAGVPGPSALVAGDGGRHAGRRGASSQ